MRARGVWTALVWLGAVTAHVTLWVSLKTGWIGPLFNDSAHRFGPGADFFALYQAGYSALHGGSIYRFEPADTVIPYGYPFRYLPVVAYTGGALLTLAPPPAAYAMWLGGCELCLLHNVRITHARTGGGVRGALLASVWLCFSPFFLELWVGQFTFLLGALLFWSVLAMDDGRPRTAQGWWVVSVLWKPASLLWVPLWLRERRFWQGLGLCGGLLLANLVYFWHFPQDWPVFTATNLGAVPTWHAGNVGLSALIYQVAGGSSFFLPVRVLASLVLALPALYVTWRRGEGAPPFWLSAALWTTLYFLVYKDVWEHHLTMLLPFLVLGLWRAPSRLLVAVTLLLALPSPFALYDVPGLGFRADPQPFWSFGVSLLHRLWRVVPLVLLYGYWLRLGIKNSA